MTCIDGFVIAVPRENRQKFIDRAKLGDSLFIELAATRDAGLVATDPQGAAFGLAGPRA